MRIAVIDCGTNTFNLLVVDSNHLGFKTVYSSKIPVKLGEGGINNSLIKEIPFNRGVQAMSTFKVLLNELDVSKIHAFATSAIRDARNGRDFKQKVFETTGIDIAIIDGNKEADLIYKGNKMAVELSELPSLIMDIGGGSTEFVIGTKDKVLWKQSYRLGAARILEMFKPSDPIDAKEIEQINSHLTSELHELKKAVDLFGPVELIGSSGAFDSVVEMIHGELNGEPFVKDKTEYSVSIHDFFKLADRVIPSTIQQRREMKGLVEMRVDMMVISCLLIKYVLQNYNIKQLRVSTYSLKEGALSELLNKTN